MITSGYVSAQRVSSVFITGEAVYVDKYGKVVGPKDPTKRTKLYGKNARIPLKEAKRLGLIDEKVAVGEDIDTDINTDINTSSSPIIVNPGADDSLKTSETLNSEQEEKKEEEKKEETKPVVENKMLTPENKMLTGENK